MPDDPVIFGNKAAQRIINAVRRIEKQPYGNNRPSPPRAPVVTGTLDAIVTSTITACNTNAGTYGVGTAQPYTDQFNTNTNSYQFVPLNGYGNGNSNSPTVLNFSVNSNSIVVGTHVGIAYHNGHFRLIWADC